MNYPMYNNSQYYMQNLQDMRDRIDTQIRNYQQSQAQNQQQPVTQPITQNFQITPTQNSNNELESKYVNNIEEVKNTFVMKTGIFTNKDFSTVWVKDVSGNIRTFKTEEIIEMDAKDKEILMLRKELEEMKGMILDATTNNSNVNEPITNEKSTRVSVNKRSNAK